MHRTYARDPRWLTVRYAASCARCGKPIPRGSEAFYYPSTRSMYCADDKCGAQEARAFRSAACDEDAYNGYGSPYAS